MAKFTEGESARVINLVYQERKNGKTLKEACQEVSKYVKSKVAEQIYNHYINKTKNKEEFLLFERPSSWKDEEVKNIIILMDKFLKEGKSRRKAAQLISEQLPSRTYEAIAAKYKTITEEEKQEVLSKHQEPVHKETFIKEKQHTQPLHELLLQAATEFETLHQKVSQLEVENKELSQYKHKYLQLVSNYQQLMDSIKQGSILIG